jgi:hypothetical protein
MISMDKNLFVKLADDIGGSGGLPEEDKDFLKSLERMVEEIENGADNPK